MPEVLLELEIGGQVATPLGTFTKKKRKPKQVKTPQGGWYPTKGKTVVTLRPEKRLWEVADA
jgi:nucleoid DNA-binding protein